MKFMKKWFVFFLLMCPFFATASEQDEKVNRKVQEAMEYSRSHTNRGPQSTEDWIRVADSAAKLLGSPTKSKSSEAQQEESGGLLDMVGDFFK